MSMAKPVRTHKHQIHIPSLEDILHLRTTAERSRHALGMEEGLRFGHLLGFFISDCDHTHPI